jgi:hypothetical protein
MFKPWFCQKKKKKKKNEKEQSFYAEGEKLQTWKGKMALRKTCNFTHLKK